MEAKHQQLLLDYLKDANLSYVLMNSIRTLVTGDSMPDNPFGPLYRHFSFFATKNDLDKQLITLRNTPISQANAPMAYLLTNSERRGGIFGLPAVMHRINTEFTSKLRAALSDVIKDFARNLSAYRLEVISSVSSAGVFRSASVPYGDVAKSPLVLRSDCLVEGPAFDAAFTIFADFVYDDIMEISSSNSLHHVRDFVVELTNESKRVISYKTMRDDKQVFIAELRAATIQRKQSYIRLMLFVPNLSLYQQDELVQSATVQKFLSSNLDKEDLVDHFQYIFARKSYYLHFLDSLRKGGGSASVSFKSMGYIPCESLYEGVFFNVENAQRYASIFYEGGQNPYQIPSLQEYGAKKKAMVLHYLKSGLVTNAVWALHEMVLTTPDTTNRQTQLEELQQVLSHECCSLYAVQKQSKALRIVINAFYDTNMRHFLKLAETLFVHLKAAVLSAFGRGCVAEIKIMKPAIAKMMEAISVNSSRTIALQDHTLMVLTRLEAICRVLADSSVEILLRHTKAVEALFTAVGFTETITKTQLLESKTTGSVVKIPAEIKRRKLPSKSGELSVISSYLADTGVLSLLVATNRELLLSYPLLPTPLHFFSMKLLLGLAYFDMYNRTSDDINAAMVKEPEETAPTMFTQNPDTKFYPSLKLPYILGRRVTLRVCAIEELAYAKLLYHSYEPSNMPSTPPAGYSFSLCSTLSGCSVLNELLNARQRGLWAVSEDAFMQGPSFNTCVTFFLDYLFEYAAWLYQTTDAIVLGFFTPHAEEPVASISGILSVAEKKTCHTLVMSAFQANSQVSLRFLVPFQGSASARAEPYYRLFCVYFNMHYAGSQNRLTSFRPPRFFEDHIRVFYDNEDFKAWNRVIPESAGNHVAVGELEAHLDELKGSGDFVRAFQLKVFIAQLKEDEIEALKSLRIFETPIDVLYELSNLSTIVFSALELKQKGERKVATEFLVTSFHSFRFYLEKTALIERNVYLEPLQSRSVNLVQEAERAVEAGDYELSLKFMKKIRRMLYVMCAQALSVAEQALELSIQA